MRHVYTVLLSTLFCFAIAKADDAPTLLKPDRVFDGTTATPHTGWVVLVRGETIAAAGPATAPTRGVPRRPGLRDQGDRRRSLTGLLEDVE